MEGYPENYDYGADPNLQVDQQVEDLYRWQMLNRMFQENDIYNYLYKIIELEASPEIKKKLTILIENARFISTANVTDRNIMVYKRRISEQIDQILESIPPHKLTYSDYIVLENIELLLHLALDRALYGFERRMQTTQIKHLVMSQEADSFAAATQPKRGILRAFGKLFG